MMRGAILALLTLLVGCSAQDAALDLELVQDLNLNTTEQLAASIDTIRLIVDSDEGLYDADEAQVGDGFRIENVDTDAAYELVIEASVPVNELPRVRLERGGLPIGPLDIRLEGVGGGGDVFATGGISSVSFVDNTTSTLPVQFNLRSRFLPPRVLEAFPTAGEVTCRSGLALLLLSKSLDASTVVEGENLIVERLDQPMSLPLTMDIDGPVIRVAFGDVPEERAHYRIWLGGDVRDLEGVALDQDPRENGEQVFSTEFFVEPTGSCTDYPWRWCHEDAAVLECPDFRSGRLRCDAGICVPGSCLESSCANGYVCEEQSAP
ncbi:MAG: hypothetical protein AAFY60_16825, partial [Myxococcota bacterium]